MKADKPIEIRKAELADFEQIYAFVNELEETVYNRAQQHKIYQTNISNENNIYLAVLWDNNVVGYLACHIQLLLHHSAPIAEIQEMFVMAEYRKAGLGKMLVTELKKLLFDRGVEQIEVTSTLHRAKAHQFYEREGFKHTHKKFIYKFSIEQE
ncbi:GNAT family N-acetyltransferase [Chondrinema litorale]|uniref:GNAT family N-acetyltransferase n=1 Tax=Chondrinema litorale TaxID=2994555 RepID=UPI002543C96C|nr:GNAT family N-acetyltransferase [Chondrinema litorale]UZR97571.1 GNAT family N-acetyltransferase [Chondrinema litorale]